MIFDEVGIFLIWTFFALYIFVLVFMGGFHNDSFVLICKKEKPTPAATEVGEMKKLLNCSSFILNDVLR